MSYPATKCRNKAQTELNGKREIYVATKSFSVTTLLKKIVKKTVATILYFVGTMIIAKELCRDKISSVAT